MKRKLFQIASLVLASSTFVTLADAAIVPKGTKLAKNQIINKDNSSEPSSLDPSHCRDNIGANIIMDLFEGLVSDDPVGKIIPATASHWEISKDGLKYTFHLRKDAKWSDGTAVVANDFVYSFKRFVDPKTASEMAYLAEMIKNARRINEGKLNTDLLGVKAIDPHTFEITLEEPTPYFLSVVSGINFVPLRKDIIEKFQMAWTQPGNLVGNGAYKLTSWKIGDKSTLEMNPNYWDSKNTVIKKVNYVVAQDKTASYRMYESGQLDWTYGIPPGQYQNLSKKYPKELRSAPDLSSSYLAFNNTKPPFNNKKLREALSIVINRENFTNNFSFYS